MAAVIPAGQSITENGDEAVVVLPLHRLIHLIETESEQLTARLIEQVKSSPNAPDYSRVPEDELFASVYETYRHLSDWLLVKDEQQVERRARRVGAERAAQNVPFSQVVWVVVMMKETLLEFLMQVKRDEPRDPDGQVKLFQLLDHFFNRAICYAAAGHEQHMSSGETSGI